MYTIERIQALVNQLSMLAVVLLKEENYHEPMVLGFCETNIVPVHLGQIMQVAEDLFKEGKVDEATSVKAGMWESVRKITRERNCFGTIMITEAWVRALSPEEGEKLTPDSPSPRFSPDRQEALTLSWEFRMEDGSRKSGSRQWIFKRTPDGKVAEVEEPIEIDGAHSSGAATSFIA